LGLRIGIILAEVIEFARIARRVVGERGGCIGLGRVCWCWWESGDIADAEFARQLLTPMADPANECNLVEFSFGLHNEGFYLGVTGVVGPRETWLGLLGRHVPDNGAAKCGNNCTLFATLKETAEQDTHPFPSLGAFPVAEVGLLVHDLDVECANLVAKVREEVRLLSKVLVLRAHLAEPLVGGIGFGHDGFPAAVHLVERLLPGTDSF